MSQSQLIFKEEISKLILGKFKITYDMNVRLRNSAFYLQLILQIQFWYFVFGFTNQARAYPFAAAWSNSFHDIRTKTRNRSSVWKTAAWLLSQNLEMVDNSVLESLKSKKKDDKWRLLIDAITVDILTINALIILR